MTVDSLVRALHPADRSKGKGRVSFEVGEGSSELAMCWVVIGAVSAHIQKVELSISLHMLDHCT